MYRISNNQRRSLRNHCDRVVQEIPRINHETVEQYTRNIAYAACIRSQLARRKSITDMPEAVEYCINYINKKYDLI